jgi:hypothetical protein
MFKNAIYALTSGLFVIGVSALAHCFGLNEAHHPAVEAAIFLALGLLFGFKVFGKLSWAFSARLALLATLLCLLLSSLNGPGMQFTKYPATSDGVFYTTFLVFSTLYLIAQRRKKRVAQAGNTTN